MTSITFVADKSTHELALTLENDALLEGIETFTIVLSLDATDDATTLMTGFIDDNADTANVFILDKSSKSRKQPELTFILLKCTYYSMLT